MASAINVGPDLAIAGSARSGTSFLASAVGAHQDVDPGAVKEPNYFSRQLHRGPDWYDSLYLPRRENLLRLDASMSYTFKHYPDALKQLVHASPDVHVVYSVRHPLRRLLSHYQLHVNYFQNEAASSLSEALTSDNVYVGASDYGHWLTELTSLLPPEQLTVVPFPVITEQPDEVLRTVLAAVGLDLHDYRGVSGTAQAHQNQVVRFRSPAFMHARRMVRRWGFYPSVRRAVGTERLRWLRGRLTRPVAREPLEAALRACSPSQLSELRELYADARVSAHALLRSQDERLSLQWAESWAAECPPEPWDAEVLA